MSTETVTIALPTIAKAHQTAASADVLDPELTVEQPCTQAATTTGSENAPFKCNICQRNYTRVDHLARHYRSHTRERPFPCETCGKHFSRADLLRRHAAAHTNGPPTKRKRQPSPSTRVSVACAACSAAKLKCKEDKPCRRCKDKGIECVTPGPEHGLQKRQKSAQTSTMSESATEQPQRQEKVFESQPMLGLTEQPAQPQHPQHQGQQHELQNFDYTHIPLSDTHISLSEGPNYREFNEQGYGPESESMPARFESSLPNRTDNMSNIDMFTVPQQGIPMISDGWFSHDTSLGDFLTDIMMPISPAGLATSNASLGASTETRDVLNFGVETSFDLNDIDFGLLNSYTTLPPQGYQQVNDESYPPSRGEEAQAVAVNNLSIEAFQRSLWRWNPGKLDQGHGEQMNLTLPSDVGLSVAHTPRPCGERLAHNARDKIMAMLFDVCGSKTLSRIVSQFPSVEVLEHLMQDFLLLHASKTDTFIHIPTFHPNSIKAELLAMTIAHGAVGSPVPVIRKLGFALQEAVRLAIPKAFENDNSTTRDLEMLQAYLLELDVGIWSGIKRKMEIAESHGLPMVTMLRRSGRFRKNRPSPEAPTRDDSPQTLDEKWRAWVEIESFKRLAYKMMIHDSQVSMSCLVSPLVTYAEMSLELPATSKLWKAKSASIWRDVYLEQSTSTMQRLPNLTSCVHDAHVMVEVCDQIDLPFSIEIVLSLIWNLIWGARQLNSVAKQHGLRSVANMALVSGHWQQELSQTLRNFRMAVSDVEPLTPAAAVSHEHLLLNVNVSFEELSIFAGKEGGQDARRIFPLLRQWADSRDSRQAAWHAGQILREAALFAPGTLRDFYAIALYHAGLTLWAYGLLSNELSRQSRRRSRSYSSAANMALTSPPQELVFLDGNETADIQKFVSLNRATPVIQQWLSSNKGSNDHSTRDPVSLDDPKAVMETVISVLQQNHGAENGNIVPPLVENLTHLMQDLSRAAYMVIKKR